MKKCDIITAGRCQPIQNREVQRYESRQERIFRHCHEASPSVLIGVAPVNFCDLDATTVPDENIVSWALVTIVLSSVVVNRLLENVDVQCSFVPNKCCHPLTVSLFSYCLCFFTEYTLDTSSVTAVQLHPNRTTEQNDDIVCASIDIAG